jgi:YD repeat-containing protein
MRQILRASARWAGVTAALLMVLASPADAATQAVLYTYDFNGRVTSALYDNGVCIVFAYDANGNRTARTVNTFTGTPTWGTMVWGCAKWTP